MLKIFEAYAERRGLDCSKFRFSLYGTCIHPEETPRSLELEENELIDVLLKPYSDYVADRESESITIRLKDQMGDEMFVSYKFYISQSLLFKFKST